MATHLDLEEQEQLDQLKAFWKQYGNLITWVLIVALAGFAGWAVWNNWKQEQAIKAGSLYEELNKAVQAGDVDKTSRVFADMRERFAGTGYTQQAALLAAKLSSTRVSPMRPTPAWPGPPRTQRKRNTARSHVCAWPVCFSMPRNTTKR